ncbi:hypothetical protein O1611_g8932 [Lasiodiplodia mahajangana]|uniref:Uncharacterized protein n=1 Tax=Lasiodiplodia mahajangana TaxID=1108764 RepID=A0ACC2JC00_9PEZI|nr:hypothetical protein O1611_g8932 [Lasiodiplodia mahajangana]
MSIRPLPDSVIAQIKSSTTITSLNGVVCGLLRNSLDAGATRVTISVDYVRGNCLVEDDGVGILPAEFKSSGGLGKLHFTSKYPVQEDAHGKYGTFLASLASLSLLSITSHHQKWHTHNSIQIHNSDILARHIPSLPDQRLLSFPHGTRVTVRDLFGSMPVRVKQRAIDIERGIHSKYWGNLRRDIVALILAWNRLISVSVRESANQWTFSIRTGQTYRDDKELELELDLVARVSKVLYQAQLSDDNKFESWVPLKASAGGLSVSGAVSLCPVATKRIQFISIGIHPVPNEHGLNVLYEEINRIFSNSSYGVEEDVGNLTSGEHDRRAKDGFTTQDLKGRKGVDRWPMFYIKIHSSRWARHITSEGADELLDERRGDLAAIIDILRAVAYEFLKKYRFRPKRVRNAKEDTTDRGLRMGSLKIGPSNKHDLKSSSGIGTSDEQLVGDLAKTQLNIHRDRRSRSRPESPFDLWSRIKSGSSQQLLSDGKIDTGFTVDRYPASGSSAATTPDSTIDNSDTTPPLFGSDGSLLRAPFTTASSAPPGVDRRHQSVEVENKPLNENVRWTNPITKEVSIIDPRTGFVIQPSDCCSKEGHDMVSLDRRKRLRSHPKPASDANRSVWLGELLSSWENPVFETTEPRIPAVSGEDNSLSGLTQPPGCSTWFSDSSEVGPSIQGRVSKMALRNADIVAQVDRKFIFAKVQVDSYQAASLLVIIDQHAADERCRVESLMADYFERTSNVGVSDTTSSQVASTPATSRACTESLERPLKFDVSSRDATQLERTAKYFAHWGIHYHIVSTSETRNAHHRQVEVTELPPSIAERCRLEPRLLVELLRKETWKAEAYTPVNDTDTRDGETTTPHWISKFHGCPEGILDMINSRACRSSIMFNDLLSRDECVALLKRLADCAFPFQCAHGRPSMVPLVDLGDNVACMSDERKPTDSVWKRLRAWNAEGRKPDHGD